MRRNTTGLLYAMAALLAGFAAGANAGQTASVTFATQGSFTYIDKDHPWAFGQVNVQ